MQQVALLVSLNGYCKFMISRLTLQMNRNLVIGAIAGFGVYFPQALMTGKVVSAPLPVSLLVGILMVPGIYFGMSPFLVFAIIYGNITACLAVWADTLSTDIEIQGLTRELYMDCRGFLTALTTVIKTFSFHLLHITILILFGVITLAYRSVSFLIGDYELEYFIVIITIGHLAFAVLSAIPLMFFAFFEQEVSVKIRCLITKLIDIDTKESGKIVKHLQMYKGFSAQDFFYINKSSLSTIFTTFIAYLIILLQFRVSERNS